jgi:transcriptional regulator of arginine metabolism
MDATKVQRLEALRRLVRAGQARTQADLRKALRARGLAADQSTLSRDLRELGVRKLAGRYELPAAADAGSAVGHRRPMLEPTRGRPAGLAAAVQRYTVCGPHLLVIRTTTGMAQPVAVAIDQAGEPAIVATIAGDDAIFVATTNRRSQAVVLRRLEQWFGEKG